MVSNSVRQTVLTSLSAIGASREARFYADLFAKQDAERFALIVIDPRCLKNPLLEALIGNLKLLFDLGLSPILLVGAMDKERTSVKFQAQRLSRELDQASVRSIKLNTRSYGLIPDVRKKAKSGLMPILEMTERRGDMNLNALVQEINPNKVIFLQPSGGLMLRGNRVRNLDTDSLPDWLETKPGLSEGQRCFLKFVNEMEEGNTERRSYIIASPLNLLPELFTTKGSGTLIKKRAVIKKHKSFKTLDKRLLRRSIEGAFGKILSETYFDASIHSAFLEENYQGGAIFTKFEGYLYLSKFWVSEQARGEGQAKEIWDVMTQRENAFFWRSRLRNPFNDWYMRKCDGMQVQAPWRVFWKGFEQEDIAKAISFACSQSEDFSEPETRHV
jgi:acetylglutamate kinase